MSAWESSEDLSLLVNWMDSPRPDSGPEWTAWHTEHCKQVWASWGIPAISIELMANGKIRDTPARAALTRSRGPLRILSAIVDQRKTVAAAWWLVNTTEQPPEFLRVKPPLFLPIRAFARKSWFDGDVADRIERARLLVLDDLGDESLDRGGGLRAQVDALIDARYANLLPTVVTTNLSALAFARRYGARALRRIHERGEYIELSAAPARASTDTEANNETAEHGR